MDKQTEKAISIFMEKMPRMVEPADGGTLTDFQVEVWRLENDFNKLVAQCFNANSLGKKDPIAHLERGDRESQLKYRDVLAEVEILRALWDLVQHAFPYIESPAFSPFDRYFFFVVFSEQLRNCLLYYRQFQDFSLKTATQEAEIRKKDHSSLSEKQLETLRKIHAGLPENKPLNELIAISEKYSSRSSELEKALADFKVKVSCAHTVKEEILMANRKGRLRQKIGSWALLDGEEKPRRKLKS